MVGTLVLQFLNSYTKYLAYFSRVLMTKILAVTRYVLFCHAHSENILRFWHSYLRIGVLVLKTFMNPF